MNTVVRRRIEMAARVRSFIRANPADGTAYGNARTEFETLVARAEALAAQQDAGRVSARAASANRKELRHALHSLFLRYLSGLGVVAERSEAGLGVQFRLPKTSLTNSAFLIATRRMLDEAEKQKVLLMSRGMSATLLESLGKGADEFERLDESVRLARRQHTGASKDLEGLSVELLEHVRLLDAMVRYEFGTNREIIGAWESARRLPGKAAEPAAPPVGEQPVTPPVQGGVAPAA
jgi:hypothetical protein